MPPTPPPPTPEKCGRGGAGTNSLSCLEHKIVWHWSKAKVPLVRNLNANDKCKRWMWIGGQVKFSPCMVCVILLCSGSVYEGDFPSNKTFAFGPITTCSNWFSHHHSSHSLTGVWKHSYTNSMFTIFLSHSHSSFTFALCMNGISALPTVSKHWVCMPRW